MTAATRRRSSGATVSRSTIEATVRTSYGVRPRLRAGRRSTVRHARANAATWLASSSSAELVAVNS
jgi:hypothetical protein